MINTHKQYKYQEDTDIVFGVRWFERNQKILLWLLNAPLVKIWFRWVMRIRTFDCKLNDRIVEIKPNHFSFNFQQGVSIKSKAFRDSFKGPDAKILYRRAKKNYLKQGIRYVDITSKDIRTNDKFARRLYYAFKPMWHLIHFWDLTFANRISQQLNFGFDTLTAYPATSGSPVSGYTRRNGVNESFSDIRAGAGNGKEAYSYLQVYLESDVASTNQFYANYRSVVMYDTSSLPDDATISNATISLYGGTEWGTGDAFSGTKPDLHVAQGGAASESALANGDYAQTYHGTTSFGYYPTGSWVQAQYKDISMNASGISAVSKTGLSKFSLQTSWDLNNSFTGTWANYKRGGYTNIWGVDQTGESTDPKLVVTYTVGSSFPRKGLLGVGR